MSVITRLSAGFKAEGNADDLHFRPECILNYKIGDLLHPLPGNDEIKDN